MNNHINLIPTKVIVIIDFSRIKKILCTNENYVNYSYTYLYVIVLRLNNVILKFSYWYTNNYFIKIKLNNS